MKLLDQLLVAHAKVARPRSLTKANRHIQYLSLLEANPNIHYRRLAELSGDGAATVQATMKELEGQGEVEVSETIESRTKLWRITNVGRSVLKSSKASRNLHRGKKGGSGSNP